MKQIQSSTAKAQFAELLDEVERGETIVITRHGRPIAHIVPAESARAAEVRQVIADIKALRKRTGRATADEIRVWRDEGRK